MAKKALLDALEQTIGKYVKNLDAESLNVAVWSGKIELNSLELDVDACNAELDRHAADAPNLALPLRVVSGSFGSFQVDVPWANLMSKPVVLRAKGLNISVQPFDRAASADYSYMQVNTKSAEVRARKIEEQRDKSIAAANEYRKQKRAWRNLALQQDLGNSEEHQTSKTQPTENSTYAGRLVRRILENIQVEISDVHVSLKGMGCAAGVVLESMNLVTTDKDGRRTFVDRTSVVAAGQLENSFLYKVLSIRGLGIYLDGDEFTSKSNMGISATNDGLDHSYVLAPLTFEAKLRQADGNVCIEFPKYLLASELSSLSVILSKSQLDLSRKIAEQIRPATRSSLSSRPLFPEYRPLVAISAGAPARDWWRYAVRCIGRLNGRRSWLEYMIAFRKRKAYIPLYKRREHAKTRSWLSPLTNEELVEVTEIERDRSISLEGIMTWRNIADAQVEKEEEKHDAEEARKKPSNSLFSFYLHGGSSTTTTQVPADDNEEPPIQLSAEELKALEMDSLAQFADELTNDSRLYDVKFVLGSFRINLTSNDLPVVALEMGTVLASFDCNADGSFVFKFNLASLQISDKVTPHSLFPYILRNQQHLSDGESPNCNSTPEDAFQINLEKTKTGDQQIKLKLSTFEMVASPLLLKELKRFVSITRTRRLKTAQPSLEQSMSGSVDLFYDATEGTHSMIHGLGMSGTTRRDFESAPVSPAVDVSPDISNKLFDAWKAKTENEISWVIDLDVSAPIVIVPENCVNPQANVLIFDLGHFNVQYGNIATASKVNSWFVENPRVDDGDTTSVLDSGSLNINRLAFVIGKANQVKHLVRKFEPGESSVGDEAILEPLSLVLDFGVESGADEDVPRLCIFGVIPSITLGLSPLQLSRILRVFNSWKTLLYKLFPNKNNPKSRPPGFSSHEKTLSGASTQISNKAPCNEQTRGKAIFFSARQSGIEPRFHADFRLQAFSAKLSSDSGKGIEAHLVSVSASLSSFSDGSSFSRLSMGWFWILDRLENRFPRIQRLVAHSRLPLSSGDFAEGDRYDIRTQLEKQGAFQNDSVRSTDLADITLEVKGATPLSSDDPFSSSEIATEPYEVHAILDAKFTSLCINWNPQAIKVIIETASMFSSSLKSSDQASVGTLILPIPEDQPRRQSRLSLVSLKTKNEANQNSAILVRAEMESFEVSLNSARDDLPLFILTMSRTICSIASSEDDDRKISLVLGDVRISSPEMGRTDPLYRTILGLKPGTFESLLSVQYCVGQRPIQCLAMEQIDPTEYEACAKIELSPMRMVYIHSQVLALVEYATEGILGALAAKAASSAAAAAAEIASSAACKKFFSITATGFEILLPQAAFRRDFISATTGALQVGYTSLPKPGGGQASLAISNVIMRDTEGLQMQEEGIRMAVKVDLPPLDVGSKEDQALRVDIDFSRAAFMISKPQYAQLMSTLGENIGQADLFLRDNFTKLDRVEENESLCSDEQILVGGMTHAGVTLIDNPRRMYIDLHLTMFSLELCGKDADDPIIRLAAVEASIGLHTIPDELKSTKQVTLRDLVCDDRRFKAKGRQYRTLIYQDDEVRVGDEQSTPQDVFYVSYETVADRSSSIDLRIGSPRLVFIPDAIADALAFVSLERNPKEKARKPQIEIETVQSNQFVAVHSNDGDAIETSVVTQVHQSHVSTHSYTLKTSQCTVILVDLGSNCLLSNSKSSQMSPASVSETIVLKGTFDAFVSSERDARSGTLFSLSAEINGDKVEAYTAFGRSLHSPLQIVNPVKFTVKLSKHLKGDKASRIDFRAALLTPLDASFSMRNLALVNAIVSGFSECFDDVKSDVKSEEVDQRKSLTQQETVRLEQLASALEGGNPSSSVPSRLVSNASDLPAATKVDQNRPTTLIQTISVKITMPESKLTFINDLQGLDEALLRLTIRNFVVGAEVRDGVRLADGAPSFRGFDFNVHTSILADYFDASANLWKVLLLEPWEMTVKGARGASRRYRSQRPSTTVDIESFPCYLSFSEQFLMSLASANRMWSIYNTAITSAIESTDSNSREDRYDELRRSTAASAARTFITSLPYAVENHAGVDVEFLVHGAREDRRKCYSGSLEYFRFEPPAVNSTGGKRLYGQDVTFEKKVSLYVAKSCISLANLDSLVDGPMCSHELNSQAIVMIDVVREGKTVVVHISSGVDIRNQSSVAFSVSTVKSGQTNKIGICNRRNSSSTMGLPEVKSSSIVQDNGRVSKRSNNFGVPVDMMDAFRAEWARSGVSTFSLVISPVLSLASAGKLEGELKITANRSMFSEFDNIFEDEFDVTCRPISFPPSDGNISSRLDPFMLRVSVSMIMVGGKDPFIDIALKPRAFVVNHLPIAVSMESPMPHVFNSSSQEQSAGQDSFHDLMPNSTLEIFTPGPSIAARIKCKDKPMAGSATDWIEGGWIDFPLISEFRLLEPLRCVFPFSRKDFDPRSHFGARGMEFFVVEGSSSLPDPSSEHDAFTRLGEGAKPPETSGIELTAPSSGQDDRRSFYFAVYNYVVDHIGGILFEQAEAIDESALRTSKIDLGLGGQRRSQLYTQVSSPFGAFGSPCHNGRRVSLLPGSRVPIRLLQLTIEGDDGLKRSESFCVEEIPICDGGLDAKSIAWGDGISSGYFAYRKLLNTHQSEVHVVPEYVVFNGANEHEVRVAQRGGSVMVIGPGTIAPLCPPPNEPAMISVEFSHLCQGTTPYIRVDSLGMRVAIVKSVDGYPIASVAIQTVVGARDSRLVVKLGEINFGSSMKTPVQSSSIFHNDLLRLRIQWSALQLTLSEARPVVDKDHTFFNSALDRIRETVSPTISNRKGTTKQTDNRDASPRDSWAVARELSLQSGLDGNPIDAICTILLHRFTVDWQRVFKDEDKPKTAREALVSNERSQLSVIIHNVQLRDDTPHSPFPIVFSSTSQISFFDLCIRFRGPLDSDLVRVDLFDLNLAHANGVSEKIILNTSEEFVWKLLDLTDRISSVAGEFTGVKIKLNWDEEHDGYVVSISDNKAPINMESKSKYTPPRGDKLLDVGKAKVSPFTAVVSFKRTPQASRYKVRKGMRGASIVNYFTRRLKFTIDKAELNFSRYEALNVKGPPDRLMELLSTVYLSRMKLKIVTIMTAASIQDWKYLAARDDGDDEFVDGDILRVTGNLAGNTANYVLKKASKGLGGGVGAMSNTIGDGIESAADAIGARHVGAGVNSLVSGVGEGVGDAVVGLGTGTGKVLRGVGRGVGHVFGGVSGGAMIVGKGIGKGIVQGDAGVVVEGVGQGVGSAVTGFGEGVGSAVIGTADGMVSIGSGLFSGVKSVGRGITGAFEGKKKTAKKK